MQAVILHQGSGGSQGSRAFHRPEPSSSEKRKEQREVLTEVVGDQKVLFDVRVSLFAEPGGDVGVRQEIPDLIRGALD